jgi:hypothetical protein
MYAAAIGRSCHIPARRAGGAPPTPSGAIHAGWAVELIAAGPATNYTALVPLHQVQPTEQDAPVRLRVYSSLKPRWGRAFPRIQRALQDFAPTWVEWVGTPGAADVRIVHVLERSDVELCNHTNTVIIQHVTDCDMSSQELLDLWAGALLVVSFHDLEALVGSIAPDQQHRFR